MFFNIEKLATSVSSRMGKLHTIDAKCSRVRSPLGECSACIDICPLDALSFDLNHVIIADTCIDCGLCASVCPTAALTIQEPTEDALIRKAQENRTNSKATIITCQAYRPQLKISKDHKEAVNINELACLGALTVESLLLLGSLGPHTYFAFDLETCQSCPVAGGGDHFLEQAASARSIADSLSLRQADLAIIKNFKEIESKIPRTTKNQGRKAPVSDQNRRAFLSSILGGVKQLPKEFVDDFFSDVSLQETEKIAVWLEKTQAGDSLRLSLFKNYLKNNYQELTAQGINEIPHLQQIHLVNDCYFCKACSIMCPLGAIEQTEDHKLILDAGKCSGCNLCIDICVHNSLGLEAVKIDNFLKQEKITLAQTEEKTCSKCRQAILSTNPSDICFICARKPSFFK